MMCLYEHHINACISDFQDVPTNNGKENEQPFPNSALK